MCRVMSLAVQQCHVHHNTPAGLHELWYSPPNFGDQQTLLARYKIRWASFSSVCCRGTQEGHSHCAAQSWGYPEPQVCWGDCCQGIRPALLCHQIHRYAPAWMCTQQKRTQEILSWLCTQTDGQTDRQADSVFLHSSNQQDCTGL